MPPVSTSVNVRSLQSAGADRTSRVVPATGATIDRRWPVMRLNSVDFTDVRPAHKHDKWAFWP
jgi:hypothetical protein